MKALLSTSLAISLSLSVLAGDFESSRCSEIQDFQLCIETINSEVLDYTKCLPIVEENNKNDTSSNDIDVMRTCSSWKNIQAKNLQIDLETEQVAISDDEKTSVAKLVYFSKWAGYAYSSLSGEEFLEDFKLIESEIYSAKMVIGYDRETNSIISSFRGSVDWRNYIEDVDLKKTSYYLCEGCEVHQGFLFTYDQVREESITYFKELVARYPEAEVVSVGHSLGGALSILGALDQAQYVQKINLYTYGQPRVGNQEFVLYQNEMIQGDHLRAVYMNDPYPTVPFEAVLNYYHAGREVHFYGCRDTDYILYPFDKDDRPYTDLSSDEDHQGYWCFTQQVKHQEELIRQ